jgi:hypothetical protein
MFKKPLFLLPMLALVFGVAGAAYFKVFDSGFLWKKEKELSKNEEGMPRALAKHLEELQKTIPGNGGESGDGPGGYAAQKLATMAYPKTDIHLDQVLGARTAFQQIRERSNNNPNGGTTWQSYGPTVAKVPKFQYRDATVYTPKKYFAAGRTTTMAISPNCDKKNCRLWIGAAGGGIWRTDNALDKNPDWTYLSETFGINSVGSIALDPNDTTVNTIWVGTGEGNASADCVFGVGVYKSTDGGDTWTGPLGGSVFNGRAVATIAIKTGDPNTIYVGTTRAVNGMSSVIGGGTSILVPGAAMWGLYKSTDGGTNWSLIHNGGVDLTGCDDPAAVASNTTQCSPRGVRNVKIDPVDPLVVYASSYSRGVWRSPDEGTTWEQILVPMDGGAGTIDRAEIAVTTLPPNNTTRMYVGEGHNGAGGQYSRLFRSDDVRTGTPTFTDLTSSSTADPGYGSFNYCTGQCWYDNLVYTPPGNPDIVYLGGAFQYNENDPPNPPNDTTPWISNGRGLVLSQDAGVSWTDLTYDSTGVEFPFGIHPDNHTLVTDPNDPLLFFEGNDGGVVRNSGNLTDKSVFCNQRQLTGTDLTQCQALLSGIPKKLQSINKGLNTLQFQSLSVNPFNSKNVQGGTQDNGTWETKKKTDVWLNTMIGDGGQSGFDVGEKDFRFHTFFLGQADVNFKAGDVADWNWVADPWFIAGEAGAASFYIPIIHDPTVSKTLYAGLLHAWRTKTYGMGAMTEQEMRQHCNEWTGDFTVVCGDWEPLGDPTAVGQLTDASYGDRAGGFVAAVERTSTDNSTLWAATSTGRVFVSSNADADPASSVTFTRIDGLSLADPQRFVSGIYIDPANSNQAYISYTGFSANTPTEPGHVFLVTYDPVGGTATWTSLDGIAGDPGALGDIPINDVVFDSATGDLYVSNDFGVLREDAASGINWQLAAPGMPNVETPGLTIVTADRKLYAATHGRGAWVLDLP